MRKNNIIKMVIVLLLIMSCIISVNAKNVKIQRDRTLVKDGPGNYYDTVTVLKLGSVVNHITDSKEDPGWIEIAFSSKKGFISKMALKGATSSGSSFPDFESLDTEKVNEIAPASYTAAIKGFALDYANKKGFSVDNLDDLMKLTEFTRMEFGKYRRQMKLPLNPSSDDLIGLENGFINQRIKAYGLTASLSVLQGGVVFDEEMTKKLNVIANVINRQTADYDVKYRVWIIKDKEPVAFSGPGGYIFLSDKLVQVLQEDDELIAVIAHEIGHIIMRHGIKDLILEEARKSADDAFSELDESTEDEEMLEVSDDLDSVMDEAIAACSRVRDIKQEMEADKIGVELLNRFKIDKKSLITALQKIDSAMGQTYPEYKSQMSKRIKKIKRMK